MTHLQLPHKWRSSKERGTLLATFLARYNDVLAHRQYKCKACDELINSNGNREHIISLGSHYGIQNFICYKCLNSFCDNCVDEHGRDMFAFCYHCKKDYCVNCDEVEGCKSCDETFCSGCDNLTSCTTCNDVFCPDCTPSKKCACCVNEAVCRDCTEETTHLCNWEGCEEVFCSNCEDDHLLSHRTFDQGNDSE